MMRVGLTGGIASGKSTVAAWLRENGVPVADADVVARTVLSPGSPAAAELAHALGPGVCGPDGTLDRAALRARVAADPAARRTLEAITHPRIRAAAADWCAAEAAAGQPVAVWEAALLIESGAAAGWDRLLVVACPPALQHRRLIARSGLDPAEAARWVEAQAGNPRRFAAADAVIWNTGSPAALLAAAAAAWAAIGGPPLPLPLRT